MFLLDECVFGKSLPWLYCRVYSVTNTNMLMLELMGMSILLAAATVQFLGRKVRLDLGGQWTEEFRIGFAYREAQEGKLD